MVPIAISSDWQNPQGMNCFFCSDFVGLQISWKTTRGLPNLRISPVTCMAISVMWTLGETYKVYLPIFLAEKVGVYRLKAARTHRQRHLLRKKVKVWRPQTFRDFGPPPPLVRMWDLSTVLNSRNLPYYIFWANPLPPQCGRHIWMPP